MLISSQIVKIAKNWRFPVCTKLSKMTPVYFRYFSQRELK